MSQTCCVTVVGDGVVGKTCLLLYYVNGKLADENSYVPTVFDMHSEVICINEQDVRIKLYDTAGQEDYERLRQLAYNETDVFILCYAFDERNSIENIRIKWQKELANYKKCPIVLVGTKFDRVRRAYAEEAVNYGRALARSINAAAFFETSAMTGLNVKQAIDEAIRITLRRRSRRCTIL